MMGRMMAFIVVVVCTAQVVLLRAQERTQEPTLDDWLRRRALQNEECGASRTYALCVGSRVIGYYALAVGAVAHAAVLRALRRRVSGLARRASGAALRWHGPAR